MFDEGFPGEDAKMISPCLDCSELGDGLGAFGNSVLGQLSGQDQADCCLDLARGDSGLLVVKGQASSLGCHLWTGRNGGGDRNFQAIPSARKL